MSAILRTFASFVGLAIATTSAATAEDQRGAPARGSDNAAARLAFFESNIRPVLVKHCYECHSAESGSAEGNLRLDTREAALGGGGRGPAVVPGKPDESLLLTAIAHADADLKMPPNRERLSEQVIADVRRWIADGAVDPRDGPANAAAWDVDFAKARQFWAYRKPVEHVAPTTRDPAWARRKLDHFVRASLEEAKLEPSPDAEPAVLLRRLYFDLVGLPPTPADVEAFVSAFSPAARLPVFGSSQDGQQGRTEEGERAYEEIVDRLLASPQFGETWGRHWLDVARFGESSGKEANTTFPYAWRYRDYVIDCFNDDVPYDRFLTEQIAGDLLPYDDDAERARLLIATGYLAMGPKNLDEGNAAQFTADLIDEQIDALSRGVLANSVACARCHDHKSDPFAMRDYYALAGVFGSTKTYFGTFVTPSNQVGGDPLVLPRLDDISIYQPSVPRERVEKLKAELAALRREEEAGKAAAMAAALAGEDPGEKFSLRDALRLFWSAGRIEGELEMVDDDGRALPLAVGVLDRETPSDAPLLDRGDVAKPKEAVPRGFPRVIELVGVAPPPSDESGRRQLAQWLTHADQPLTARVMVNRVWHNLFGQGLVATVDNFGTTGEPPSHPELLDHLTVRFTAEGWSVKRLVREIVLSRTYRQASTFDAEKFQIDPENRLLWRAAKRRLPAEAIRDTMLSVAGELDLQRREGSLVAAIGDRPVSLIGLDKKLPADLDGSLHRSVYLPVLRDRLPDVLDLFDFAEPSLVTGHRETTNVPLQALYLMNSPFVQARSKGLAERLIRDVDSPERQVRRAYLLCFARPPDATEMQTALSYLSGRDDSSQDASEGKAERLASFCQALFATAEFRNLD